MRAITLAQCEVASISARRDKSLRFSTETCELSDEHRAAFLALQGSSCRMLIEPMEADEEPVEVKSTKEQKTPSSRLRSVLFVYWKQQGSPGDFSTYYEASVEKVISQVKAKLDPS